MTAPLQSAVPSSHAGGNVAATFTAANLTSGTKLIAYLQIASANGGVDPSCSGISDGNGNSFTQLTDQASTGNPGTGVFTQHTQIWVLDTPAGDVGTKPTITAALTGTGVYGDMLVQEVPGLLPGTSCLDGTAGKTGGSATTSYSTGTPSYTSATAGEYLVSVYTDNGGSGTPRPSWTAPAGYTADSNAINNQLFGNVGVAYKNSAGGAESDGWSVTASNFDIWGTVLVAFKLSALTVTTTSLPSATEGGSYSATLTATSGTAPYTWSISAGSLPGWASLNASAGVISGTAPNQIQITSFTVEVTDAASNTATQPLVLPVGPYPDGAPGGGPWLLEFSDDFNIPYPTRYGTGPNPAVWGDAYANGLRIAAAADSLEWGVPGYYACSVANSVLSITAAFQNPQLIDPSVTNPMVPGGNTGRYTSGIASSFRGLAFTYGYVEARVKNTSSSAAAGTWPAFWMMPRSGPQIPPEIDIDEWDAPGGGDNEVHAGYDSTAGVFTSFFYSGDGTGTQNFHVYGMRLDPAHVTFFYDGAQVFQAAYDGNPYAWVVNLNNAVRANLTGAGFPQTFQVDYVRLWVPQGVPSQPAITSVSPASGIPSAGQVTVSFAPVAGATSYRVTASVTDLWDTSGKTISSTPAITATGASSPLTLTGLTNGYPYTFTVAAVNATGYSIESLPVPSLAPASGSGLLMAAFP